MGAPFFTEKSRPPTETAILSALGGSGGAWRELFDGIRAQHPDVSERWGYYTDGKSWLLKASRKSKTVFWLSVEQGAFRVAFYFPERLAGTLLASDLSERCKAEIRRGASSGRLRRVAVTFGPRRGLRDVMTLIALKKTLR
ncbi:DUF3788 family protein [Anaeromyxobacter oryzae]|uniref:DUF3788 family protein n=1 Tax=Anaeromyxobacter oryzae TaxID=2918170 RepID=A0ABM7WPP9_9BACT|nr:DUF3788 family protein [Anaeromyxobacter oryzae]BDG01442.1 hypothetical protein AMOR_04380 [Anaeromyxobacter oryzae]